MSSPPTFRKGRGAISNPEGRFESLRIESVDDGWAGTSQLEDSARPAGEGETIGDDGLIDLAQELPPLETTITAERAKSIITRNDSPDIPFEQSINPYRGCEHGCSYCSSGDTLILMADGRTRPLSELKVGDGIYGTKRVGWYRRYTKSKVLAHWSVIKPAFKTTLEDGTTLVTSADHRFLTERGWKFVTGTMGTSYTQRPYLTVNNKLMGTGAFAEGVIQNDDYRRGYLCGMIRGDAHLGMRSYVRKSGETGRLCQFRLALCDQEALARAQDYLSGYEIATTEFQFQAATANRKGMRAIRAQSFEKVNSIYRLIAWPIFLTTEWAAGFLAGIFDAEGSFSQTVLRISNTDFKIIAWISRCLRIFDFTFVIEHVHRETTKPIDVVRLTGGLREHLRFFHTLQPAISRKLDIVGQAVKSDARLGVVSIEPLGKAMRLYDITTETEDFIANGVVNHNCYARPAHSYVNLSPGLDFETKLFYKAHAAELLEKELRRPGYVCKSISLGSNTDPYQPIERKLRVTRSILEVLQKFRHPLTIVTKGHLVTRDIDILAEMAKDELVRVYVSITTLDPALKRTLEPRAPAPVARLNAVRALNEAKIPVGVMVAPIIPVVNDHEIERILEAAVDSGAQSAGFVMLRLPYEVKDLFREWLAAHYPLRAGHVMSLVQQMRGGKDNDPNFGSRMRGAGAYAQLIERRFNAACTRLGLNLNRERRRGVSAHFRVPQPSNGQLNLL